MYKRIEKSQKSKSRAAANFSVRNKSSVDQPYNLANNRLTKAQSSRGVVQAKGINYEAGIGSLWHVHKDHVKYNGDNSSRVNFAGRSKTSIRNEMKAYHNTLGHSKGRHHTYIQCRKWITRNL